MNREEFLKWKKELETIIDRYRGVSQETIEFKRDNFISMLESVVRLFDKENTRANVLEDRNETIIKLLHDKNLSLQEKQQILQEENDVKSE
jgi:hypothetical protein